MWPFKKKEKKKELASNPLFLAKRAGCVEKVMFDYIIVAEVRYETKKPLVRLGQQVRKGQPVGKK